MGEMSMSARIPTHMHWLKTSLGSCKVLRKFSVNVYELEFPADMDISPIFNVANLYPYRGYNVEGLEEIQDHIEIWK